MKFFGGKRKVIESLLEEYRGAVLSCVRELCALLNKYTKESDQAQLRELIEQVSAHEGRADALRRKAQVLLYSQSLFPESRGDLLGLLESVDYLANGAEATAFMLQTHCLVIPSEFGERINKLAHICLRCVETVLEAKALLFSDYTSAIELIGRVNELESEADKVERQLIEDIFKSHEKGTTKIVLRDFVLRLSGIADRAENTGDRIRIVVAKRGR